MQQTVRVVSMGTTTLPTGNSDDGFYFADLTPFNTEGDKPRHLWILVEDDNIVSGGRGAVAGFDLDFIYASTTLTGEPNLIPGVANVSNFRSLATDSIVSFSGGYKTPTLADDPVEWRSLHLQGADSRTSVNLASATLNIIDGKNSFFGHAVSLGEGGKILFDFDMTKTNTGKFFSYLYFGDIGPANDGVRVTVSDTPLSLTASATTSMKLSGTATNDTIRLGEGDNLDLGAGKDRLEGGAGDDDLASAGDNDVLVGGAGNDKLDGGSGVDTAIFAGKFKDAKITTTLATVGTLTVTTAADGTDTAINVERLQFDDGVLRFDLGTNGAATYRLYQAALARQPDEGGLAVQVGAVDKGLTLLQLAQNFLGSAEFATKYGTNVSDATYVNALYTNVLGRGPDSGGLAVQIDALAHGLSRAQLLLNFAESAENKTLTGQYTANGLFSPYPDASFG